MDMRTPIPLSKRRLKIWISLLSVTRSTEQHLRAFLRVDHDTTLPRFDVMAALWRRRDGITMSELSRLLLVSGGNVTIVINRLVSDGLVARATSVTDRRVIHVKLTKKGLSDFERIAEQHEAEIDALFGNLTESDLVRLHAILKRVMKEAS